jgi:hypothetical protein
MKTERARSGLLGRREVMGVLFYGDPCCPPNPRERRIRRNWRALNLDAVEYQLGWTPRRLSRDRRFGARFAHASICSL